MTPARVIHLHPQGRHDPAMRGVLYKSHGEWSIANTMDYCGLLAELVPSSALGPWDSETPTHGMSDKQSFCGRLSTYQGSKTSMIFISRIVMYVHTIYTRSRTLVWRVPQMKTAT